MKIIPFSIMGLLMILIISCGTNTGSSSPTESPDESTSVEPTMAKVNKGIGPITVLNLDGEIDRALAGEGQRLYEQYCTACHKATERFIGPAPQGVLERRSPEWIMNMILNPEEMTRTDPDAKALLMEYNGAPMANQHLTEDQARAILEYFRTL